MQQQQERQNRLMQILALGLMSSPSPPYHCRHHHQTVLHDDSTSGHWVSHQATGFHNLFGVVWCGV